jgi:hypothetical protein
MTAGTHGRTILVQVTSYNQVSAIVMSYSNAHFMGIC